MNSVKNFLLILAVFLVGLQVSLNRSLWNEKIQWQEPALVEEILWMPKMVQIFSVGHLSAALDLIFLQCLVDSTLKKVEPGKHFPLYYRFKVLVELDPLFFEATWMGGHFLTVIQGDGLGAEDLLQRSLNFVTTELPSYSDHFKQKYWPEPWKIPFLLAYTELFHLDHLPRAALAFQQAAQMPGSPHYLKHLVDRLNRPGGKYEVGLKLLTFMLAGVKEGAKSEQIREQLEQKKQNLSVLAYLDQLNRHMIRPSVLDPWQGRLFLNSKKQWDTETPHKAVFGLN